MAKRKIDVWQCECEAVNLKGKPCYQCGRTFADVQHDRKKAKSAVKKQSKKPEPVWKGEYIESYLRLKKKNIKKS